MDSARTNRWFLAAAGVVMQIALGAVYAWSVFRIPLTTTYGWTISPVTLTFELAILVLGFASLLGGLWMRASGPRPVVIAAGVLYGLGSILAGRAGDRRARPAWGQAVNREWRKDSISRNSRFTA